MKKFNKGMIITSTVAAALTALTFAGCGSTITNETTPEVAPVNAVQAVKNDEAAKPAASVTVENTEGKTVETITAAKKNSKKKSNKKKKSKKTTEQPTETVQQSVQPVVIVPTVQVQPVQSQKAAETAVSTQAPAAAPTETIPAAWVDGDIYAGSYVEETAGRGMMEITRNNDGTYSVEVNWASSASEKNSWNFTGEFNGRGVMNYTNCRKTTDAYDVNGSYTYDSYGLMTPYTTYTMGSGYIEFKEEGILEWHDDMGDILPGTRFVSKTAYTKAPETNTKANEIGTAGSNYLENETAAELPTGWFYDGNGSGTIMNIVKNGSSYNFVVSMPDEKGGYNTYSFSGKLENGKVAYTAGQQDNLVYNADGSVKSAKFVSNDHVGQVRMSNTGIVWNDSYGPNFVFISKSM